VPAFEGHALEVDEPEAHRHAVDRDDMHRPQEQALERAPYQALAGDASRVVGADIERRHENFL